MKCFELNRICFQSICEYYRLDRHLGYIFCFLLKQPNVKIQFNCFDSSAVWLLFSLGSLKANQNKELLNSIQSMTIVKNIHTFKEDL